MTPAARLRYERESRSLTIYRAAGILDVNVIDLIRMENEEAPLVPGAVDFGLVVALYQQAARAAYVNAMEVGAR